MRSVAKLRLMILYVRKNIACSFLCRCSRRGLKRVIRFSGGAERRVGGTSGCRLAVERHTDTDESPCLCDGLLDLTAVAVLLSRDLHGCPCEVVEVSVGPAVI